MAGVENRLVTIRSLFGAATILLALVILVVMPSTAQLSPGWRTPIIAFELARTELDLTWLAGPTAGELRAGFDLGHAFDMAFPFAYAGLLFTTLLLSARGQRRTAFKYIGLAVAVVTISADLCENMVLLEITKTLGAGSAIGDLLAPLAWTTWTKWLGIAVLAFLTSIARWNHRRLSAALCGLVGLVTLTAALVRSPMTGETMALGVTMMSALFAVGSIVELLRKRKRQTADG